MNTSAKKPDTFVTASLAAALEDLTEIIKPKIEPVSEVQPEQVTALSNGEGPQAALDGVSGKSIIALEDELNTMLTNELTDGGLQIQEDLENAVRATVALESIAEALNATVAQGTATTASNAGFCVAMEHVMHATHIPTAGMNYGLESGEEESALKNPAVAAKKMAAFASDVASKISHVVINVLERIAQFVGNFVDTMRERFGSNAAAAEKLIPALRDLPRDGVTLTDKTLIAALRPVGTDDITTQYNKFFQYVERASGDLMDTFFKNAAPMLKSIAEGSNNIESWEIKESPDMTFMLSFINNHYKFKGAEGDVRKYVTDKFVGGFVFKVATNAERVKDNISFEAGVVREEGEDVSELNIRSPFDAAAVLRQITMTEKNMASVTNVLSKLKNYKPSSAPKESNEKTQNLFQYANSVMTVTNAVFTTIAPSYINAAFVNGRNYIRLVQAMIASAKPAGSSEQAAAPAAA